MGLATFRIFANSLSPVFKLNQLTITLFISKRLLGELSVNLSRLYAKLGRLNIPNLTISCHMPRLKGLTVCKTNSLSSDSGKLGESKSDERLTFAEKFS